MFRARWARVQRHICTTQLGSNFISKTLSAPQCPRACFTPPLACYSVASELPRCENRTLGAAATRFYSSISNKTHAATMGEGINADVSLRACMRTAEMEFVASPLTTVWRKRCVCVCVCMLCAVCSAYRVRGLDVLIKGLNL